MTEYRNHSLSKSLAIESGRASARRRVRLKLSYRVLAPLAATADVAAIVLSCLASTAAYHYAILGRVIEVPQYLALAALASALFVVSGRSAGDYDIAQLLNFKLQSRRTLARWSAVMLFLTAVAFTMKVGAEFSRGATIVFALSALTALVALRATWRMMLTDGLELRRLATRPVALIADPQTTISSDIMDLLARHGLQPIQQYVLPADLDDPQAGNRTLSQAALAIRGSPVEEIVFCTDISRWNLLGGLLADFRSIPLPVSFIPCGPSSRLFQMQFHRIGDSVSFELQGAPRTLAQRGAKRALDLVAATAALVVLAPLFVMTAIAIKLDSPGPVIFRQRRSGFNRRHFQILKFRTMSVLEDGSEIVQAGRNDPRVTRIGAWLRRTSIDELPQLFNVLKGEMSIVGPRPHALTHDDQFSALVDKYAFRHHVKPGMTGWAQVNGYRGETRTIADIEQRVKLDLYYIDNWTVRLDVKILAMTVAEVLRAKNAY